MMPLIYVNELLGFITIWSVILKVLNPMISKTNKLDNEFAANYQLKMHTYAGNEWQRNLSKFTSVVVVVILGT